MLLCLLPGDERYFCICEPSVLPRENNSMLELRSSTLLYNILLLPLKSNHNWKKLKLVQEIPLFICEHFKTQKQLQDHFTQNNTRTLWLLMIIWIDILYNLARAHLQTMFSSLICTLTVHPSVYTGGGRRSKRIWHECNVTFTRLYGNILLVLLSLAIANVAKYQLYVNSR